jgi:hypothetical protein
MFSALSSPEHAAALIVNIAETTTAPIRPRRCVGREGVPDGLPDCGRGRARRSAPCELVASRSPKFSP